MMDWLGNLLDIENLESLVDVQMQFAAAWARNRGVLVLLCCLALAAASVVFYVRYQALRHRKVRIPMAIFRALVLASLVWILAEPEAVLKVRTTPRPTLVVLFDGTDSMNMRDKVSPTAQAALRQALGAEAPAFSEDLDKGPSRQDLVRAAIRSEDLGWLEALNERFHLRGYVLDQSDGVREILMSRSSPDAVDTALVAEQLGGCDAGVTALGAALDEIRRRTQNHLLAGVVVVSDFDQNRGQPALDAAKRLKAPLYTVGVGPTEAVDLTISLNPPPDLKEGERAVIPIELRQRGLSGRDADVMLLARPMTFEGARPDLRFEVVGTVTVPLDAGTVEATVPYEPAVSGRYTLEARVKPFDEEVRRDNNAAQREVMVRDDALKILFVEYEPTWEWRFIKEVFYRDPMIGREGFRTYLDSADFTVRRSSDIFIEMLTTLARSRQEFFSYDVIFLSDIPSRVLPSHPRDSQGYQGIQEMLVEYVSKFGGGLVVLAGPRFGPSALIDTKIADMLPVVVGPGFRRRNGQFDLRLTPNAARYDFMSLADNAYENAEAWRNFKDLQWYQPCLRPHPLATVLACHPTDRCVDGKTPQPLVAIRRYGKGEVVYFAFNEIWRLRKRYGEKYYGRLWGQLIYRMGLSRALGAQKRFRVQTDRQRYQAGQKVRIIVEAYTKDYTPLEIEADSLSAKLIAQPASGRDKPSQTELRIPLSRDKVFFETSVPVFTAGPHRLLVRDPVTMKDVETTFKVAPTTAERRSTVRNIDVQHAMAQDTRGKAYELHEVHTMATDVTSRSTGEISTRRRVLWNTWLVLGLVLVLMFGEWTTRKLLNLQ